MRKIYLEIDGTRTGLNNENGLFFTDLAGFGAKFNSKYSEISDGFYYNTDNKQAQGSIVGTLNIMTNAYAKYKTFADSIMTASKLVLVYDPLGNGTEYYADCHISYMTKSESVCGVYMAVPIAFSLDSIWYQDSSVQVTGSGSFTFGGHIPCGVKLSFGGALTNPQIKITTGGTAVADCDLTYDLASGKRIEYSNFYGDSHINLKYGSVTSDIISYADAYKTIFGRPSQNFTVSVTDDNDATPTVNIQIRKYWRTV